MAESVVTCEICGLDDSYRLLYPCKNNSRCGLGRHIECIDWDNKTRRKPSPLAATSLLCSLCANATPAEGVTDTGPDQPLSMDAQRPATAATPAAGKIPAWLSSAAGGNGTAFAVPTAQHQIVRDVVEELDGDDDDDDDYDGDYDLHRARYTNMTSSTAPSAQQTGTTVAGSAWGRLPLPLVAAGGNASHPAAKPATGAAGAAAGVVQQPQGASQDSESEDEDRPLKRRRQLLVAERAADAGAHGSVGLKRTGSSSGPQAAAAGTPAAGASAAAASAAAAEGPADGQPGQSAGGQGGNGSGGSGLLQRFKGQLSKEGRHAQFLNILQPEGGGRRRHAGSTGAAAPQAQLPSPGAAAAPTQSAGPAVAATHGPEGELTRQNSKQQQQQQRQPQQQDGRDAANAAHASTEQEGTVGTGLAAAASQDRLHAKGSDSAAGARPGQQPQQQVAAPSRLWDAGGSGGIEHRGSLPGAAGRPASGTAAGAAKLLDAGGSGTLEHRVSLQGTAGRPASGAAAAAGPAGPAPTSNTTKPQLQSAGSAQGAAAAATAATAGGRLSAAGGAGAATAAGMGTAAAVRRPSLLPKPRPEGGGAAGPGQVPVRGRAPGQGQYATFNIMQALPSRASVNNNNTAGAGLSKQPYMSSAGAAAGYPPSIPLATQWSGPAQAPQQDSSAAGPSSAQPQSGAVAAGADTETAEVERTVIWTGRVTLELGHSQQKSLNMELAASKAHLSMITLGEILGSCVFSARHVSRSEVEATHPLILETHKFYKENSPCETCLTMTLRFSLGPAADSFQELLTTMRRQEDSMLMVELPQFNEKKLARLAQSPTLQRLLGFNGTPDGHKLFFVPYCVPMDVRQEEKGYRDCLLCLTGTRYHVHKVSVWNKTHGSKGILIPEDRIKPAEPKMVHFRDNPPSKEKDSQAFKQLEKRVRAGEFRKPVAPEAAEGAEEAKDDDAAAEEQKDGPGSETPAAADASGGAAAGTEPTEPGSGADTAVVTEATVAHWLPDAAADRDQQPVHEPHRDEDMAAPGGDDGASSTDDSGTMQIDTQQDRMATDAGLHTQRDGQAACTAAAAAAAAVDGGLRSARGQQVESVQASAPASAPGGGGGGGGRGWQQEQQPQAGEQDPGGSRAADDEHPTPAATPEGPPPVAGVAAHAAAAAAAVAPAPVEDRGLEDQQLQMQCSASEARGAGGTWGTMATAAVQRQLSMTSSWPPPGGPGGGPGGPGGGRGDPLAGPPAIQHGNHVPLSWAWLVDPPGALSLHSSLQLQDTTPGFVELGPMASRSYERVGAVPMQANTVTDNVATATVPAASDSDPIRQPAPSTLTSSSSDMSMDCDDDQETVRAARSQWLQAEPPTAPATSAARNDTTGATSSLAVVPLDWRSVNSTFEVTAVTMAAAPVAPPVQQDAPMEPPLIRTWRDLVPWQGPAAEAAARPAALAQRTAAAQPAAAARPAAPAQTAAAAGRVNWSMVLLPLLQAASFTADTLNNPFWHKLRSQLPQLWSNLKVVPKLPLRQCRVKVLASDGEMQQLEPALNAAAEAFGLPWHRGSLGSAPADWSDTDVLLLSESALEKATGNKAIIIKCIAIQPVEVYRAESVARGLQLLCQGADPGAAATLVGALQLAQAAGVAAKQCVPLLPHRVVVTLDAQGFMGTPAPILQRLIGCMVAASNTWTDEPTWALQMRAADVKAIQDRGSPEHKDVLQRTLCPIRRSSTTTTEGKAASAGAGADGGPFGGVAATSAAGGSSTGVPLQHQHQQLLQIIDRSHESSPGALQVIRDAVKVMHLMRPGRIVIAAYSQSQKESTQEHFDRDGRRCKDVLVGEVSEVVTFLDLMLQGSWGV